MCILLRETVYNAVEVGETEMKERGGNKQHCLELYIKRKPHKHPDVMERKAKIKKGKTCLGKKTSDGILRGKEVKTREKERKTGLVGKLKGEQGTPRTREGQRERSIVCTSNQKKEKEKKKKKKKEKERKKQNFNMSFLTI